jgi:hypothetical protein
MKAVKELFDVIFTIVAGPVLVLLFILILYIAVVNFNVDFRPALSILIATGAIWVPFLLFWLAFDYWMFFVKKRFMLSKGRYTLRIKLPQEVYKSPEVMESVLTQVLNVQSSDNLMQTYIDGRHPLIMSLELVSTGGRVEFFLNVADVRVKNVFEAQLYAQYPGIEIVEEKIDYTGEVYWDPEVWEIMSFYLQKKKDQEFPIKTYIDFHMDDLPKEEQKYEPMSAMLEQMGTVGPNERSWLQILCRPHIEKNFKVGSLQTVPTWEVGVKQKINQMMGRDEKGKGPLEIESQPRLTSGERATIEAMERNVSKYAYETEIRWIYAAKKGYFNGAAIGPMLRTFSAYDMIGRNAIGVQWRTDFNYNMFSDRSGQKKMRWKKAELTNYKKRSFFDSQLDRNIPGPKVWSVEELATIYHIPSSTVMTPGLQRISSTRREAPPNLPVGNL